MKGIKLCPELLKISAGRLPSLFFKGGDVRGE
jgi:hypothetical protein